VPHNGDVQSVTLSDHLRVVWRRWWVVAAVVIACTSAAFGLSALQTPLYKATASLMYQEPANIADPLNSSSGTDANNLALETQSVVNTVDSPDVTSLASERLSGTPGAEGYEVTALVMAPDSSTGGTMSDVVSISAEGKDPKVSAEVANTYAGAVIDTRVEREKARLRAAQDVIRSQMERFTTEASKLSTDYLLLAQRLSDLQVAEATTTGDFRIIRRAVAPDAPSSPKPMRTSVLALGAGLLAGVALAFLLDQFDTRIRTHREVTDILALPVIGRVPRVSSTVLREGPLVSLHDPDGAAAEAIRMLRSNLTWSSVDGEWKSLLITSSTKGEGKTLAVCNLAIVLAQAGKKVVLVDADLRAPRVHTAFSLPNGVGLTSVIKDAKPLPDTLQLISLIGTAHPHIRVSSEMSARPATANDGTLRVLTSGPLPPNPGEVVASRRLAAVLAALTESDVDYVLVDAPPLLSVGDVAALALVTDTLLIVANVSRVTRPMLENTRHALDTLPCRKLGVVTVGERLDSSAYGYGRDSQRASHSE